MKTKVLVIDDSALIRSLLTEIINDTKDLQVIGTAPDPLVAREMIKQLNPDVLTLDVEMPRMDGLDFLEKLMRLRPMPVLMVSTLTEKGSEITLRALELGATDFVTKPKMGISQGMQQYADEITDKIRTAAKAKISTLQSIAKAAVSAGEPQSAIRNPLISSEKLLIIGASTGGTEAIKSFLMQMPSDCPGILITQHMPAGFTKSFADRLDSLCKISVKEAVDGERILPGHAYIAPGDQHLLLARSGANYITRLSDSEPVNRHKPSVDVLFDSAAANAGKNAIGIILTGMGKDGAAGMLEMKNAGAYNFAQNEESCVVYGMPREAIAHGGVHEIAHLKDLPRLVLHYLATNSERALRV
ncbi:two-component system, chemotaxis family, response regulator CheB [Methylophilus rhizosphaerae]|uniref:Protein-glutamate methylesterase/protein-glutamine glutaminase n=1 Tax=Methylophilus rhizosphaerae TaxID=492660 RepID=A0A1G9FB60_9PROT|nr:chemotaxis response regulator protein-glutamate methylesterase [Methylophilus rhizosphaerae]SDK85483.1 two-component system, chemotaxis family, response regulator CheB [Methylophilus rhizosphaerae]